MFFIRFGVLAVFAIMLLPAVPSPHNQFASSDDREFCVRYPKTCDASGELFEAFKIKLSYAVTLARQSLETQTPSGRQPQSAHNSAPKLDGRFGEWRPVVRPHRDPYAANDTLRRDERSTEWRGN